MSLSYKLAPPVGLRRNLRHLYWDIFWFGVLAGTTLGFISIYVTRLGAFSFQVGLLTAGPALVNLLVTLPAGKWLEGKPIIQATFRSSIWQRIGYLVLVIVPWLFPFTGQVWAIIGLTLLMSVAGTILAIAFNAMYAEVVPDEWRGEAAAWRNVLLAVSSTMSTLLAGYILENLKFPLNYQVVFLIGAIGAGMSSYHLSRIQPSIKGGLRMRFRPIAIINRVLAGSWIKMIKPRDRTFSVSSPFGKPLLRLDLLSGSFGLFLVGYLTFYIFQYFSIPLFPIFYVNEIYLTDGQISLGTAIYYGAMILGSLFLNRFSLRYGHRTVMLLGVTLFPLFPLLLGLAKDAVLYYAACVLVGVVVAFINAGLINRLMERVPADDRPAHMALHNLALNLGILIGSLLGPVVGDLLGVREAVLVGAGLRMIAAFLLWKWG